MKEAREKILIRSSEKMKESLERGHALSSTRKCNGEEENQLERGNN
jgi:hypothetical protein